MLEHLRVCFLKPIMIGKYMGQKAYKTLLIHLLLALIAVIPFTVTKAVNNRLDYEAYNYARDAFMLTDTTYSFKLESGKLTVTKPFYYGGYEANIYFIGSNIDALRNVPVVFSTPSVFFFEDHVEIAFGLVDLYSATYQELEALDIDCNKIKNYEFSELDKYYSLLQTIYSKNHTSSVVLYSVFVYLSMVLEVLVIGVFFGLISFISKPIIPFKVRFKMALDALMIVFFGYLVGYLTGVLWIKYITFVIAYIFLLISFKAIVPIKINPNGPMNSDKN